MSPKTPPHEWVGMTGYKMNLFSQQFMKFQEVLKIGLLKLPPETPPWCGVGWVKLFWVRMIPGSIRTCVPNLVAVRSCRKKEGGGVQTDTHAHQTCQVSRITRESHGLPVSLTDFGNFSRLTAGTHIAHGYL